MHPQQQDDVEQYVQETYDYHSQDVPKKDDVNITADEAMEIAIGESENVEYTIDSDNSPYLEVRANVPNTDDPTLPVNTLRMWFLGVVFTLVCNIALLLW